jgi:hypothetical protein
MAEEGILALDRGYTPDVEESKEELQRKLEQTRHSISNTMSEIKETVAHQVQAVKDTFDWREQYKKHPCAWSVGAAGVGFLAGYKIADTFKNGSDRAYRPENQYAATPQQKAYEARLKADASSLAGEFAEDKPGLVERFKESSAYEGLSKEVSSLGNQVLTELSATASAVVVPFLLSKFKELVGIDRIEQSYPSKVKEGRTAKRTDWTEPDRSPRPEPALGHS